MLKCITDDKTKIKGNYNTHIAQNLMVVFEKCDIKTQKACKSEEEISEWMQNKYILTLTNIKSFIQYEFFEDSIAETSQIQWFPLT